MFFFSLSHSLFFLFLFSLNCGTWESLQHGNNWGVQIQPCVFSAWLVLPEAADTLKFRVRKIFLDRISPEMQTAWMRPNTRICHWLWPFFWSNTGSRIVTSPPYFTRKQRDVRTTAFCVPAHFVNNLLYISKHRAEQWTLGQCVTYDAHRILQRPGNPWEIFL